MGKKKGSGFWQKRKQQRKEQKGKKKEYNSQSQLAALFSKITKQFNLAEHNRFTLSDSKRKRGRQNIDTSYGDYAKKNKTLVKLYAEQYEETNLGNFEKEKMEKLIKDTYKNPYTVKAYTSAFNFFQESIRLLKDTPFHKEKAQIEEKYGRFELMSNKEMREYFEEENLLRKAADTSVKIATHDDKKVLRDYLEDSKRPHSKEASLIVEISSIVGTREEGAIGLKGNHITLNNDGSATVRLKEKGLKERWTVVRNAEHVERLKELKDGLEKEGWYVVPRLTRNSGSRKGTKMDNKTMSTTIGSIISSASKDCGINTDAQSVSCHSFRKLAAGNFTLEYAKLGHQGAKAEYEKMRKAHSERREKDPNLVDLDAKYQEALDKLNWQRKPGSQGPHDPGKRRRSAQNELKELPFDKLCLFMSSVQIGHYRLDVMRYYVKWDSVMKELKGNN
jgi:integrase